MSREKGKIIRSEGENETEKILSKICDDTFLKLWVYPNPFRKQGKELCDVLVVFEKHIFIFSVKDIKFNTEIDIKTAWNRWRNKAVDNSIKQIKQAESWIKKFPTEIYLDPQCQTKMPIELNSGDYTFHRIVVAHGAEHACKKFSDDNVYGSLAISYGNLLPDGKNIHFPFMVDLAKSEVIHVFDSFNLDLILGELDTITDLLAYFEAKEAAVSKYDLINYCGEEDLLAHYFHNYDTRKKQHFIGTKQKKINFISIGEGEWADFIQTESYRRKKEADEVSYFWDELIQKTLQNALDNTLLGDSDLFNSRSALREMAKEPRFMRRELSKAMVNSIKRMPEFKGEAGRNLGSYPSFFPDQRYVFLQLTPLEGKDYDTEYRPIRAEMLKIACGVEKVKRPTSNRVVGIAVDAPKYAKDQISEDFILLDCSNWSKKDTEHYMEANAVLNFFETDKVEMTRAKSYQFPPAPKKHTTKKRKIGRNEKCPCGSGRKYKYCHYEIDR